MCSFHSCIRVCRILSIQSVLLLGGLPVKALGQTDGRKCRPCLRRARVSGRQKPDLTKFVYCSRYLYTIYHFTASTLPGLIQSRVTYTHTEITTLTLIYDLPINPPISPSRDLPRSSHLSSAIRKMTFLKRFPPLHSLQFLIQFHKRFHGFSFLDFPSGGA